MTELKQGDYVVWMNENGTAPLIIYEVTSINEELGKAWCKRPVGNDDVLVMNLSELAKVLPLEDEDELGRWEEEGGG